MNRSLLALTLIACAGPAPRPPPRLADRVEVQVVQVGWMQLDKGQLNRPPVEDRRPGHHAPDQVEAAEIAQSILEKCRKGASMDASVPAKIKRAKEIASGRGLKTEIEADTLEAAIAVAMAHIPVNGDVEVLEDVIEYQPEAADNDC